MTNPLLDLAAADQAVWLDDLRREILENGELQRLIDQDGVKGLTSNPSIFQKAIGAGDDYDERIKNLAHGGEIEIDNLYEQLVVADIRDAADLFRPVYDRLDGRDGYVSLEVSPHLASDTDGTIMEARRLWFEVNRPNLMIKVPGTKAGAPAIRRLISEGINVNVTLLFGLDAYLAVADAHMQGLEARREQGGDISKVHGVASFFVSRIDTAIDKKIDERLPNAPPEEARVLKNLRGKVAIANAKVAYQRYLDIVGGARWKQLAGLGASPQRLLWASTGTKDPAYSDVLYPEALIGAETVDTLPPKTLDAFRDHGRVTPTLEQDVESAMDILASAERMGLDLNSVTEALATDGARLFTEAFDQLIQTIAEKRDRMLDHNRARRTAS